MKDKLWRKAVVYIVDDDEQVGRAIARLMKESGYDYEVFPDAQSFLGAALKQADVCCALLDIHLPKMDGMELQERMNAEMPEVPVVFITGHGDLENSVQAFRRGAVHFLSKPFNNEQLLKVVEEAFLRSYKRHEAAILLQSARIGYERLTAREREVFLGVVRGLLNKTIADQSGITETTVKVHRARVMDKMQALSVAQLVRLSMVLAEAGVIDREDVALPEHRQ